MLIQAIIAKETKIDIKLRKCKQRSFANCIELALWLKSKYQVYFLKFLQDFDVLKLKIVR